MGLPVVKEDRIYTYSDYRIWPDEERWELIHGVAWDMSAAPNRYHQGLTMELARQIANYLEGKPCRVYIAPFDVLLPGFGETEEDDITNVVQPDISVICERNKLTAKGCTGAPDFIIEILSPSTSKKDHFDKLNLYEEFGVQEYWIVDPGNRYVQVYRLSENGKYPKAPEVFEREGLVASSVVSGLEIDIGKVFSAE